MPIGPARMPLFDHLGELRRRLTIVVVSVFAAAIVLYFATPVVLDILEDPIRSFVPDGKFYITTTLGGFGLRFSLAIKMAVVMCTPMIIWQILAFFLPALKPRERKWFLPTFIAALALFIIGTVFCYCIILNPAFQWLTDQASGFATILPEAGQWVDIIIKFELGFGIGFEMPLVVFYLVMFGVVPYKKLRASWRAVYIGLLVFSAAVTPDASPVTMGLMFAAMVVLYEISLLAARVGLSHRIKRKEEAEKAEELEAQEARAELKDLKQRYREHLWGEEESEGK